MKYIYYMIFGLIHLPWWGYLVITLVLTHITILSVTIFLHRCQSHRSIDLHPIVSHFFRFWLWLTTGMVTCEWVAIHRKHHAYVDKKEDPHSPQIFGIKKLLLEGTELYQKEIKNTETLNKYGNLTPNDWIERNLYSPHNILGVSILLIINLALFGFIGLSIWGIQMLWIPFFGAGVINGIGHYWGYRNFSTSDYSRNIMPLGVVTGGEELHNNHHAYPSSAKFSYYWYEFDLGWAWIKLLAFLKLATVKKTIPTFRLSKVSKTTIDYSTLETIVLNRYAIMNEYYKTVKDICKNEVDTLKQKYSLKVNPLKLKDILTQESAPLICKEQNFIQKLSEKSPTLRIVFELQYELISIWQRSNLQGKELIGLLQEWCRHAETSGLTQLQLFANKLKAIY
jgi:stearoyl-CoA desaturase (delta-9 desaturase)